MTDRLRFDHRIIMIENINNNDFSSPKPPLPEPLRALEIGTFTWHSVVERLPKIGRRVIEENPLPPGIVAGLEDLIAGIPGSPIRTLSSDSSSDVLDWARYVAPYLGQNWLQAPWFFAENYFYRRILEATGYFEKGPYYLSDPFEEQKGQGLDISRAGIASLSRQINQWIEAPDWDVFEHLLDLTLWGNQADLSLWPASSDEKPDHRDPEERQAHLVVDQTEDLVAYLSGRAWPKKRIDLVADNAGFELVCDLALADFLISVGWVDTVHMHLKAYPTFVSDAMIKDVRETLTFLISAFHPDHTRIFADRISILLDEGHLLLEDHVYWNSPLPGWEMPESLRQEFSNSDLVIFKGDANYRRLLDDRHWPFTTPFYDVVRYFPAPLVCLRVAKSEVAAGLDPGQPERLAQIDPEWVYDGKWGMIQFCLLRP